MQCVLQSMQQAGVYGTCPLLSPKYLATGSLCCMRGSWCSLSLYLWRSSFFSSAVITTCSGTYTEPTQHPGSSSPEITHQPCMFIARGGRPGKRKDTNLGLLCVCWHTSSCSVILIISSASMNCSRMYLGAMSTSDCFAEGVIPCCTTMIAREMFSSCIRWQYLWATHAPWEVGLRLCDTCMSLPMHHVVEHHTEHTGRVYQQHDIISMTMMSSCACSAAAARYMMTSSPWRWCHHVLGMHVATYGADSLFDDFDSNFRVFREEHKHLICIVMKRSYLIH